MESLKGKIAVITGGNSGIGLATAKIFSDEGAKVVIFGRNEVTLSQALDFIGPGTIGVQGDVTNMEDLDRLFDKVRDEYGKIDVLLANAGVAGMRPLEEVDGEFFDSIFDINVKGLFFTVQKAAPLLVEGSSVILTTSGVNQSGRPNVSVYAASKAAVRSLARTFAAELIGRGVRVNALSPGVVRTQIMARNEEPTDTPRAARPAIADRIPLKRLGQAEEIAKGALFLASDDSSYVLGVELNVDGGLSQL